ncbi:hypothetical protein ACROAE_19495 [Shewanella sp. MF05960]|uniref:hypothetical protein n=1 Tax=Shewanella sp. MF05960 TaxID=3434874 RepID=UPI003D7A21C9
MTTSILVSQLVKTSNLMRSGKEAEAAQQFHKCIDLLETELISHRNQQSIINILPLILAAQERNDWLSLADFLEYDLVEMLCY